MVRRLSRGVRSEKWMDAGPLYLDAVSLPDGRPHGERGRRHAPDAVQQREAGTGAHCTGHLTGKHREAAQGKAAYTHTHTHTHTHGTDQLTGQITWQLIVNVQHSAEIIRFTVNFMVFCITAYWMVHVWTLTVSHVFIALTQASAPLTCLLSPAPRLDPDHLLSHGWAGPLRTQKRGGDTVKMSVLGVFFLQ